ncbi:MAG TPA: bifunctional UDP-N-acetylglucosamine diphosphorylase/glucosamine-1-phosphate N-acetyltransferase GlmU [Candidatus Binatia bacterium]|nr:bifunctional UDP-N-acetylglucosamine diphosphorylase/glucosamine-1-phosphate N-acetyltransferase GlmU [Candidatus Binatia bacterium]
MADAGSLGVVVLAAGLGTRMRSQQAKVLHELGGRPLLRYPLAAVGTLDPDRVVVVVGHQADAVRKVAEASGLRGLETAVQAEQRGTGHAVRCAAPALDGFDGDVMILYGDAPLIRPATLKRLLDAHRDQQADITLLTMRFSDPTGYGRIVRESDGRVRGIVEQKDATEAERAITEVNPGFYCVRAEVLLPLLAQLRSDNAQGEFYLTDVVGLAAQAGRRVVTVETDRPEELAGINTRVELARMETQLRAETVERLMAAGVTFEDPATAYVGPDVTIGADTIVGPNVTLRGRTRIGGGCRLDGTSWLTDATLADGVHLRFGCVVEEAEIGPGAIIGPFARLRPGTQLAERVHIGNFVETKKARVGAGTKANHLTYLGDCEIGPDTNVGAGTITCNYDGFAKHKTTIGARVQIGSDTQLVAPVTVGDDAYIAAGTTVTKDVPGGALAVSRVPVRFVEGWTVRRRARASGAPNPAPVPAKPAKKKSASKAVTPRRTKTETRRTAVAATSARKTARPRAKVAKATAKTRRRR